MVVMGKMQHTFIIGSCVRLIWYLSMITGHLEKGSAMGLIQVAEKETFDTVFHRKFLCKIKELEIHMI